MAKNTAKKKTSPVCERRLLSVMFVGVAVVAAICASARSGIAQQPAEKAGSVNAVASPNAAADSDKPESRESDNQYRIGLGDELSIQVFGRAQLSRDERVDMRGMIKMPLIEEDIRASCRTESELAEEIARIYREHQLLKNPAVFVSVKDFQSQPVAVIGSVNSPGRFMLRRRIRLLELLVFQAGGPSANAGRRIQILSTVPLAACEEPNGNSTDPSAEGRLATYSLEDVLGGNDSSNPYIHQGDIVNIPTADQAFVVGNVLRPSAIPIVKPITLGRALAMVGGTLYNSKKDKIRITREVSGSSLTTEILVDLHAIDKSKGEDFLLQAGDVVEVATKGGFQAILRQLAGSIVPTVTGMPVRVVR
jgi:polysaccharide biosynthesis/export protein